MQVTAVSTEVYGEIMTIGTGAEYSNKLSPCSEANNSKAGQEIHYNLQ
jgi:hypothetical protein